MKALKPIRTLVIWTLISSALAALAAWLTWLAGCLYLPAVPLCRHDYGGAIVAIVGMLLALLPVTYTARQRALRAAGRGMYARPVSGRTESVGGRVAGWLESAAHFAIEGEVWAAGDERRGWHPLLDVPPEHGWIVPMDDGSAVIVRWGEFRAWLHEAWEFQQKPANRRRGATSQRTWDGRIGRDQVQARNHLLETVGALRRNRLTANSTARIEGTPWEILERLAAEWPPERI